MESNLEKTLGNENATERQAEASTYKSSRSRLQLPLPSKACVMSYLKGAATLALGAFSAWLGFVATWGIQYDDPIATLAAATGSALFAGMALDAAGYRMG